MDNAINLKRFKELGLTTHESKCYLSLLEKDTLTVTEVSRIAGIQRANTYEALERLLAKGLCISKPDKTKKYSASDPSLIQETILAQLNKESEIKLQSLLDKKRAAVENASSLINELTPLYKKSRSKENPLEYIEIIKDPCQIHKRYLQLIAQAKEEILIFTKPPFTGSRAKLEEQVNQQADIMESRIVNKSIYEIAKDEDERRWQLEMINRAVRAGEEARVLKELPMKMGVFDSRTVIYALEDPVSKQPSFTTQIIEHRALAKSLKILFETLWQQADDYHVLEG